MYEADCLGFHLNSCGSVPLVVVQEYLFDFAWLGAFGWVGGNDVFLQLYGILLDASWLMVVFSLPISIVAEVCVWVNRLVRAWWVKRKWRRRIA